MAVELLGYIGLIFDWFNQPSSQEEGIYCVSFTKEDIVRSGILKHITERIEQYHNHVNGGVKR